MSESTITRTPVAQHVDCPPWCEGSHATAGFDDGIHACAGEAIDVRIGAWETSDPGHVLVGMQQRPGEDPRVVLIVNDRPEAVELSPAAAWSLIAQIAAMVGAAER